jgi:hypothetical protein
VPDRPVSRSDAAAAEPRQVWLGTVLAVSDTDGSPSQADDRSSPAWQWLMLHAAEYGFVPALPETAESRDAGHEAWTLRWVGREMAARLRPFDSADYAQRASTTLQAAEVALAAQDARSAEPPLWGLGDACWTVATTSGRGCPSRAASRVLQAGPRSPAGRRAGC